MVEKQILNSNPKELEKVQSVALDEETRGIYGSEEREKISKEFATWAVQKMKVMHLGTTTDESDEPMLAFTLLEPMGENKKLSAIPPESPFWNEVQKTVQLHTAAYIKANTAKNKLPIQAIRDTIFDLNSTREDVAETRLGYLQELLRTMATHAMQMENGAWDKPIQLATYYAPEWLASFLKGTLITQELSKDNTDPAENEKIQKFLQAYSQSDRMRTAIHNIKTPMRATINIYFGTLAYKGRHYDKNVGKWTKYELT